MPYSPWEEVRRPSLTSIKLITAWKTGTEWRETCLPLSEKDEHTIFQHTDSDARHGSGTLHPSWLDGLPRHVTAKGEI